MQVTTVFDLQINPAALEIATASLPAAQAGVAYKTTVEATGGTLPYAWSITDPDGVFAIDENGTITGTPTTAGIDAVIVTVTDAGN